MGEVCFLCNIELHHKSSIDKHIEYSHPDWEGYQESEVFDIIEYKDRCGNVRYKKIHKELPLVKNNVNFRKFQLRALNFKKELEDENRKLKELCSECFVEPRHTLVGEIARGMRYKRWWNYYE